MIKKIVSPATLLLLLLFSFLLPSHFIEAKTVIKENIVHLYQGNRIITIAPTTKGILHIQVKTSDKATVKSFFRIEKPVSQGLTAKFGNGFKVGRFLIEENRVNENVNGFTVFLPYPNESKNEPKKLFSSSFEAIETKLIETKQCFDNEYFYGIGTASDQLALSRRRFIIYQEAQYGNQACLYIPFFFSGGGDAFYYNAAALDSVKFHKLSDASVTYTAKQGYIDYYYYYNPNPLDTVSTFYRFSGSRSMIPRWAFGYIQSKFGYKSEKEVYDTVNKFKEYNIPLSAIVLDLQWFKHMGDLDYDAENWPDPEKMDRFLEANNIKLLTISEPFYTNDSKNYKTFAANGLFATDKEGKTFTWKDWWCFDSQYGAIVNPIAPKAQDMLGDLYVNMVKRGIDGFWTDLGEPENVRPTAYFNQYSEHQFHNYYNLAWTKLIYNAVSGEFPSKRVFILSRSGFTGSAGYGVSVWSGDSTSSFDGLAKQPVLGLNAGLTGFSYWSSDVGGFESRKEKPDEELFIRWMQFGAFSPIFRAHGSQSPREPWIHGEPALKTISYYIRMRYRLLPYIYSTAFQTYRDGIPMMRPLLFHHPEDKDTAVTQFGNQYYFGDFLLVAPVVEAAALEPETVVYLPKATWYDFYTFKKQSPGQHSFEADITRIPVYIKEGAIVPMDEGGEPVILLIPGKNESHFTWYDDDGVTNHYKQGEYEAVDIRLNCERVVFAGVKKKKEVTLKILKSALVNGKPKGAKEKDTFYFLKTTLHPGNNTVSLKR